MKKNASNNENEEFGNDIDEILKDESVTEETVSEKEDVISDTDGDFLIKQKKSENGKSAMSKSTKNKIMAIVIACIVVLAGIGFTFYKIFDKNNSFAKNNYIIKASNFTTKINSSVTDIGQFGDLFSNKTLKYSDESIVKLTPFFITDKKDVTSKKMFDGKNADIDKAIKLKQQRDNELYKYFFNAAKSQYDEGKDDYWTKEKNETFKNVKKYAANMVNRYSLPYMLADSMNITLTDEDYTAIKKQMDEEITGVGGREKFDQLSNDKFLTYELYYFLSTSEYLEQKVFTEFQKATVPASDMNKYYAEKYSLVKHVLITKAEEKDASGNAIDAATIKKENDAAKATAQLVLQKAKANENFEELIKKYNKDPGMTDNPEGYFVTNDNSYVKAFQDVALKLKVGEISDIVETEYGWHIIKRVDATEFYKKNAETMKSEFYSNEFTQIVSDIMTDFEKHIKYANNYDKITPTYFNKKSK